MLHLVRRGILLLPALVFTACGRVPVKDVRERVVVLGFDGTDPKLLSRWAEAGHLPNIRKLVRTGTFQPLGTTEPPESPVAWASFATGTNPGKHGIFDFLKVDRKRYIPDIGLVEIEKPKFLFHTLPIQGPKITNNRKGTPFYKYLADRGITTAAIRMPLSLPPEEVPNGRLLCGLGTSDVRKTWGTFYYFATDLTQWDIGNTEFGGVLVRLERGNGPRFRTDIEGPYDPRYDDYRRITIPMELEVTPDDKALRIRVQGREQTVPEGAWSDWYDFRFQAGMFVNLRGISRFYVLETYPEVRLYLEPISMDPRDPPTPISNPPQFSADLVKRIGLFKTMGWISETWGLNEEKIDEQVFLDDLFRNMDAVEAMLLDQLTREKPALTVAVFLSTDHVSHMFFRFMDPDHPRYDESLVPRFGDAILSVYQRMDTVIGKVLSLLGERDTLIVVSDHGFHIWKREFNTNTWLARNGYMVMKDADADGTLKKMDDMFSGGSFFPNVDWSRTKAYSLGLGGIFVNMKGREGQGIVEPGKEYEAVRAEIAARIREYRDPDTDAPIIQGAYRREDIFHGSQLEHAPDIQLSFFDGYRTSWQTALGAVPESIVVANLKKWSGDHCASDSSDTQGILLSNRKIVGHGHSIMDIAPTVIHLFGMPIPPDIDGKPILFAK
ncbi:MAG: alkaline phosphatase family protein [Acidobacteria bacterium]|nr:alkaline phosphatase family protein [Acidobacteriota bacterium]